MQARRIHNFQFVVFIFNSRGLLICFVVSASLGCKAQDMDRQLAVMISDQVLSVGKIQ